MKNCARCKYAEWRRTENGKLHPSGDGKCGYPWELKPLPSSMYWVGSSPKPVGGWINRRKDFEYHCPYWTQE